jgi:hypothetical protein
MRFKTPMPFHPRHSDVLDYSKNLPHTLFGINVDRDFEPQSFVERRHSPKRRSQSSRKIRMKLLALEFSDQPLKGLMSDCYRRHDNHVGVLGILRLASGFITKSQRFCL